MRVYFYDEDGLFTGSREASAISSYSTDKKPPETWPPDIPRWTGVAWEVVKDQRYRLFYYKVSGEEYIPKHPLEQVDSKFYIDIAPPGLDDYEYWDDVAEDWLIDTEQKEIDKADLVRIRLAPELPELIITNAEANLATAVSARKTEIEAEVGG